MIKYLTACLMISESKYFIDMKGLKSLQIKAEAYLKPKASIYDKVFFVKIVNDLLFSPKIFIIHARLGSKEASEYNEIFRTKLRWS